MNRENISLSCYAASPRISGSRFPVISTDRALTLFSLAWLLYFINISLDVGRQQKLCVLINNSPQLKQRLRIFKQITLSLNNR